MFESNLLSQINTASPLPTFIEVSLANSINASLSKAFQFAHVLLAEKSDTIAVTLPWSAEIYLALQTLLEHRLLFHADTTFADVMFGLRRSCIAAPTRPLPGTSRWSWWVCGPCPMPSAEERALCAPPVSAHSHTCDGAEAPQLTAGELVAAQSSSYGHLRFQPMRTWHKWVTLLLLTLRPYLSERAARWYAAQTDTANDAVQLREAYARRWPTRAKLQRLLLRLYPFYHALTEGFQFVYSTLFLLERTPYTSLYGRLAGIALRRAMGADQLSASNPRAQRAMLLARVLLVLLLLGVRLLEWTGTERGVGGVFGGGKDGEGELATPPPPVWGVDVTLPAGATGPREGECPVCGRRVTNAAVCTVSGVVGCYPCLTGTVRERGECPVTRRKTTVEGIRRIYEC